MAKTITRYEIREFGHNGSIYSRTIFCGRLVDRARATRIARRMKRWGRDVVIAPVRIAS